MPDYGLGYPPFKEEIEAIRPLRQIMYLMVAANLTLDEVGEYKLIFLNIYILNTKQLLE